MTRRFQRASSVALAAATMIFASLAPGRPALADAGFTLSTPFPHVEAQPGSSVTINLSVTSAAVDIVALSSAVPDGWSATMRGGGFVVHAVTSAPADAGEVAIEIDVPPGAAPGSYPIVVTGEDAGGSASLTVTIEVAATVDNGIELSADFPSLKGDPSSAFTYNLTIANNTPVEQTFTFAPTGPQGWTVTASPTAEARAATTTIDAGGTGTVRVSATPPATVEEGTYPIDVAVTAANGASGTISLTAEVTGTPKMQLTTADQRLDVSGKSNAQKRIPLIVSNTGSAALEDVKLAATAPTGWDVSFDPQTIPSVKPNETAQVTAIVKPAANVVAGDYAMTVRSSAGSQSSTVDLRYTVKGSRTLGVVAVGVIVVAVGALAGLFVRFGRR